MSAPFDIDKYSPAQNAGLEVISAMSSLHMPPDKFKKTAETEHGYLSEIDGNAFHAVEHLHQASKAITMAQQKLEKSKGILIRIEGMTDDPEIKKKINQFLKKEWDID